MDKKSPDNTNTTTKTPTSDHDAKAPIETSRLTNIDKDDIVTSGVTVTEEPVVVVVKPPKKKKTGIIVAIILFLLFLIGGGCLAAWYFVVYNSPENIAYNAVRQLVTADNVAISGTISLASAETNSNGNTTKIELTFGSVNNHLPTSTTATFSVSERDDQDKIVSNHEITGMLATTVMRDGVFYFKLSAGDALDVITGEAGFDEMGYEGLAMTIIDALSDEWWQVSLADILDEFDFSNNESRAVSNFYDCALDVVNADHSDEILDLYDQYRFIDISKSAQAASESDRSLYDLDLDYLALTNFINAIPESDMAETLYACYNDASRRLNGAGFDDYFTAYDVPEVSVSEMRSLIPEELDLKLEINNISHQLTGIIGSSHSRQQNLDFNINFQYTGEPATISEPEEYRPVTDLAAEIIEIVTEFFIEEDDSGPGFRVEDDCGPHMDCSSEWWVEVDA